MEPRPEGVRGTRLVSVTEPPLPMVVVHSPSGPQTVVVHTPFTQDVLRDPGEKPRRRRDLAARVRVGGARGVVAAMGSAMHTALLTPVCTSANRACEWQQQLVYTVPPT